jgi:hypothetical protein
MIHTLWGVRTLDTGTIIKRWIDGEPFGAVSEHAYSHPDQHGERSVPQGKTPSVRQMSN